MHIFYSSHERGETLRFPPFLAYPSPRHRPPWKLAYALALD